MAGGARAAAMLCGAVTLTWALAGCGSSGGDAKTPEEHPAASQESVPASASSTSSASADPQAAEKSAVLAAYDGMTAAQAKAYRQASAKETALEKYATYKALAVIRTDVDRLKASGTIVRGVIGHDAKVTALDLTAKTPKASLSDCVDLSKYQTYDTKARKVIPLPSNQPLRYVATAEAERWDGRWMVTDFDTQGGGSC